MSIKKTALMLGLMAAATTDYTNVYSDLNDPLYLGSRPSKKSPLTKKQKKARAANKRAKKARKNNR